MTMSAYSSWALPTLVERFTVMKKRGRRRQKQEERFDRVTSLDRLMLSTLTNTCKSNTHNHCEHILTTYRMAYIEENLMIRSRPREDIVDDEVSDPHEDLYKLADRWRVDKQQQKEGNVTNSMTMLTAIPEVDLGME